MKKIPVAVIPDCVMALLTEDSMPRHDWWRPVRPLILASEDPKAATHATIVALCEHFPERPYRHLDLFASMNTREQHRKRGLLFARALAFTYSGAPCGERLILESIHYGILEDFPDTVRRLANRKPSPEEIVGLTREYCANMGTQSSTDEAQLKAWAHDFCTEHAHREVMTMLDKFATDWEASVDI